MATSLELQHFAVLQLCYFHYATSIIIRATSNNPCHLTCYYTDKTPVRHATTRIERGLAVPWGAYWCFVAWQSIEQQEAGDTLTHTFEIPDWSYCQIKWFCFRGTVAGELSPSVSAIFQHHHPGILPTYFILRPNAPGYQCQISDQIGAPCPHHWANLDEDPHDGDSSMIWQSTPEWKTDLYAIESPPPPTYTPTKVTINSTIKKIGTHEFTLMAVLYIRTHDTNFWLSIEYVEDFNWNLYSWEINKNPATGEDWTPDEISNLQIGIGLGMYWHAGEAYSTAACTQIYARVDHTPP